MQNSILRVLLISLFFCPTLIFSQKLQDKTFTANQLQADFKVLKEALKAVHPALYEFQTPAEFEARCQKVENALKDGMTDLDFLALISSITKTIGCGHTYPYKKYSKAEKKRLKKLALEKRDTFNYLPFRGRFIENRLFVGESFDSLLSPTTEILSIDNHPIAELKQKTFDYPGFSEDGQGERLAQFYGKIGLLRVVYSIYYPVKDSVELMLQLPEGKISRKFKTKKSYEFKSERKLLDATQWDLKFRKGEVKKKYRRMFNSIDFYQHVDRPDVALLNIKAFGGSFKSGYDLVFDYLKAQDTKHLIIDLRGNLGGSIEAVIKLLSQTLTQPHTYTIFKRKIPSIVEESRHKENFLRPFFRKRFLKKKYKEREAEGQTVLARTIKPAIENHFDGQLYILTDGGSFSSASIFSAILQNEKNALFFGEETGGAAQLTNAVAYFEPKLNHSRITLNIPIYRINHHVEEGEKGRGIRPDHEIKETITTFLNGKDEVLEKVLSLIGVAN